MNRIIKLMILPLILANFALMGAPVGSVYKIVLDSSMIQEVAITSGATTTLLFPEPIRGVSGEGLTDRPEVQGRCQFASPPGSDIVTVRMIPGVDIWTDVYMTVGLGKELYTFKLVKATDKFAVSVKCSFPELIKPVDNGNFQARKLLISETGLMGYMRRALLEPSLRPVYPELYKDVSTKGAESTSKYPGVTASVNKVTLFGEDDAYVIQGSITNSKPETVRYDPNALQVRAGGRTFPARLVDANQFVRSGETVPVSIVLQGGAGGERAMISLANDFYIIMPEFEAQLVAAAKEAAKRNEPETLYAIGFPDATGDAMPIASETAAPASQTEAPATETQPAQGLVTQPTEAAVVAATQQAETTATAPVTEVAATEQASDVAAPVEPQAEAVAPIPVPELTPFEKELKRLEGLAVTRVPIRSQPLHVAIKALSNSAGMAYIAPPEDEFKELVTVRVPSGNPWEILQVLQDKYRFEKEFSRGLWTFYRPREDEMVMRSYQLRYNDLSATKITAPNINIGLNDNGAGTTNSNTSTGSSDTTFDTKTDGIIKGIQKLLDLPVTGLAAVVANDSVAGHVQELPPIGYSLRLPERAGDKPKTFVDYIPTSNRVLVGAPRQSHRYVEEYLKTVDRPQRQMSIRVLFVEVNKDIESALGLDPTVTGNLNFKIDGTSQGSLNAFKWTTPTATVVNTVDLNLRLHAMEEEGKGEVANRATIVAINNEEAHFSSGMQVPIQRTSVSTPSSAGTQTQGDIQYIDIGIDTRMLPRVIDDSEPGKEPIRLNLALSISAEAGTATVNGETYPRIAKRTYALPAIVKNGETLVIGGLVEAAESTTENRVPVLGKIPVLGWLFKKKDKMSKNRILNAYITPILDPLPTVEPVKYAGSNMTAGM